MKDFNQVLNQEKIRLFFLIGHHFDEKPVPLKAEIISRFGFAKERGEYWFKRMKGIEQSGNVLSSHPTRKFLQSQRIYDHYLKQVTKYLNQR